MRQGEGAGGIKTAGSEDGTHPHPGRQGATGPSPSRGEGSAVLRVAAARIDRLDAEVLLAHALGIPRMDLLLDLDRAIDPAAFAALVDRRAAGEPIAYITGSREFWSLDLRVTPDVLIPRPDSETLIEAALAHFTGTAGPRRILDLGTGSGALLLAALSEWPAATGVGVDASAAALRVAADNATRLGFGDRAAFVHGGWDAGEGAYDLVLCNPPYIATGETLPRDVVDWEPASALFAGADGLDDYRVLAPLIAGYVAPGGAGCIEIGATQAEAVAALFATEGLAVALRHDLAGLPRCLVVTK
ncbi:MAG: peptide chain release factor N(5)-glutamine methyltransferase [Janthinobacterium lividum]